MKLSAAAHLRKYQTLLKMAQANGSVARVRWRSADLGTWDTVSPVWRVIGNKIGFRFHRGKNRAFWISSVKPTKWGISIILSGSKGPAPEVLDVEWLETAADRPAGSGRIWDMVRDWLKRNYPACEIIWAGRKSDLSRSLSGRFLRVIFRFCGRCFLLIVVDQDSVGEAASALGQALLWLSCPPAGDRIKAPAVVHLLVPSGSSSILTHRCRHLNGKMVDIRIWEYEDENYPIRRAAPPEFSDEERDFRWPVTGPFRWSEQLKKVLDLAPALVRRYPRFRDYDSLRLWGLEFAQAMGADRDRLCFGVGRQRIELNQGNYDRLRDLVNEILFYRRADSPDTRHPYYRLQAERWLEALILENIPELFPEIAPESVYSQIPVYVGKDPGRVDILGVDRYGTLTVMELKISEDPDMPVQALDYWGRVIRHNANGDFQRRGYFSETKLNRHRPRIYLISPVFSFHCSTEPLVRYLDPEIEIWKISVNEDWRCGVKVLRRVRCG